MRSFALVCAAALALTAVLLAPVFARVDDSKVEAAAEVAVETWPAALYLTWRRDPSTTFVVHWHEREHEPEARLELFLPGGEGGEWIQHRSPLYAPFADRRVRTVELEGLVPDQTYLARLVHGEDSRHHEFRLRTLPASLERPLRIASGGDVLHRAEWMEETLRASVAAEPDFLLWGGDLAYADGRMDRVHRWHTFFGILLEHGTAPDGRLVPLVVAIGNHEVRGGFYWGQERGRGEREYDDDFRSDIAPFFYAAFAFPGHPGYAALDLNPEVSLIVLDSDHTGPVEGAQTEWLERTLAERARARHLLPVYHVPAYPSVRDFEGSTSRRIREHWVPLFERHGVRLALEHHDHALKRTPAILAGEAHPEGITYLGDGAFGVSVREVHAAEETWYLERSESVRHFWLLEVRRDAIEAKAFDAAGELLDQLSVPARSH